MEQIKQQAIQRLGELRMIKFMEPTARELHSSRLGLAKVQRKEMMRYKSDVEKQKEKLIKDISRIDRYIQSKNIYNAYMASRPSPLQMSRLMASGDQGISTSLIESSPVVLPKPTIFVGKRPVLIKTRLSRQRRKRFR